MEMHNPPNPDEIIREDCLEPLGLSVTTAAERLGVSRHKLSELLNGKNGVSAEMAIRLEKAGWAAPRPGPACRRLTIFGKRSGAPVRSR
jgi:addiction module HigA family antidote